MNWEPNKWGAGVLSLIAPPLGILYVHRPVLATIYFVVSIGLALIQYLLYVQQGFVMPLTWLLAAIAAFHAFRIAVNSQSENTRKWYSRWYGIFGLAFSAVLIVVLIRAILYEPFRLPAQSMYPTIPQGSNLIIQKYGYGNYEAYGVRVARTTLNKPIDRGDLLVFEFPKDRSMKYIKRVIGLPGDRIDYREKRLFVNGKAAMIDTLSELQDFELIMESLSDGKKYSVANNRTIPAKYFSATVKEGELFFLGDNRDNSLDSRYWGSASYDHVVGKVIYVFLPKGV